MKMSQDLQGNDLHFRSVASEVIGRRGKAGGTGGKKGEAFMVGGNRMGGKSCKGSNFFA